MDGHDSSGRPSSFMTGMANPQVGRLHLRAACGHPGNLRRVLRASISSGMGSKKKAHNPPLLPTVGSGLRPQPCSLMQLLPPLSSSAPAQERSGKISKSKLLVPVLGGASAGFRGRKKCNRTSHLPGVEFGHCTVQLGKGFCWLWRREDGVESFDFDSERFSSPVQDRIPMFLLQLHQCVRVLLMETARQ